MKIPFTLKLMVPLVLGLAACSKKDSNTDPGPIDVVVVPPPSPGGIDLADRNARIKVAFETLADSCNTAGGKFDLKTRNCVCPEADIPMSFQGVTKNVTVDGVKKRVFDHFECKEQLAIKPMPTSTFTSFVEMFQADKNAFIQDLTSSRYMGNGRTLEFRVPQDASTESLASIASYLDKHDVRFAIPNGNQKREGFYINLPGSKGFINRAKRLPYFDFQDTAITERSGNELFVWAPEDLSKLRHRSSASAIETVPVVSAGSNADFITGLNFYIKFLRGEASGDVIEDVSIIDQGCQVVCDYKASFRLDGRYYWYEKNYARGQHFRHAFYMGHEDGRFDAMSVLFSDYTPSVIINEKTQVDGSGKITIANQAFDNAMKQVDSEAYDVTTQDDPFYENLPKLDHFDDKNPQTSVIYMEGRSRLEEAWEQDFWLRGPYAADRPMQEGSAFGWVNGAADSLPEYFNGVWDLNYYTSSKHVREVLRDLMKDFRRGDAYAIPTDFIWIAEGNRLKELANLSKSRLATMSSVYPVGDAECNRLLGEKDDGGLLWILAGGNEGIESPKFRCPQRLHRDGLKIVVASGSKNALAEQAEYGVDYADIAADPFSYLGRRGSSYAAPKVTNVALKIIKKYGPDLSNREVRLAILLGADVDTKQRLKVRTGGALNEAFAVKAAEAIKSLSSQQRKSLVDSKADRKSLFETVISKSGSLGGSEAKNQAQYLQGAKL